MKKITINEIGSSMIEVLGLLGFLATLAVGSYSLIANAKSKIQIVRGHEQTKSIIKAMREHFSSFTPTDTSAAMLAKLGIFDNANDEGKSVNVMGYDMDITLPSAHESDFAANDPTFRLTFYDVEPKTCVNLLTADWGSDPSSGLVEISTGDGATTFQWPKDYTNGHHPLPPSIDDALTECNRANLSNITWEYYF